MCTVLYILSKHTCPHSMLKIIQKGRQCTWISTPITPWVILTFGFSHKQTMRGNKFSFELSCFPQHHSEKHFSESKNAIE